MILLFFLLNFELQAIAFRQDDERITPLIQLRFSEEDSVKYITAQVNEYANDTVGDPISELDLYFFVQRTFSQLPIGDYFNTTDENGEVRIEFPYDLSGDSAGNVIIIASIEEDDRFAGTEVSKIASFGIPVDYDIHGNRRTLAAAGANAPISLLILVNGIILAVWGIIIYIFTQIYRIRRAE
ncbi:MAG: hypothetical protein KAT31_05280 [Bacteroidales bacterium]|nr:hypothetical protein [Bacteroidales bacterium]